MGTTRPNSVPYECIASALSHETTFTAPVQGHLYYARVFSVVITPFFFLLKNEYSRLFKKPYWAGWRDNCNLFMLSWKSLFENQTYHFMGGKLKRLPGVWQQAHSMESCRQFTVKSTSSWQCMPLYTVLGDLAKVRSRTVKAPKNMLMN